MRSTDPRCLCFHWNLSQQNDVYMYSHSRHSVFSYTYEYLIFVLSVSWHKLFLGNILLLRLEQKKPSLYWTNTHTPQWNLKLLLTIHSESHSWHQKLNTCIALSVPDVVGMLIWHHHFQWLQFIWWWGCLKHIKQIKWSSSSFTNLA